MFARIIDGTVTDLRPVMPPSSLTVDGTQRVFPDNGAWTPELAAACGWRAVVQTPRPADTETQTWERRVIVRPNGTPAIRWDARDKTPEEIAGERLESSFASIRANLVALRQANAAMLAAGGLDPANSVALADHVEMLTRGINGLISLITRTLPPS